MLFMENGIVFDGSRNVVVHASTATDLLVAAISKKIIQPGDLIAQFQTKNIYERPIFSIYLGNGMIITGTKTGSIIESFVQKVEQSNNIPCFIATRIKFIDSEHTKPYYTGDGANIMRHALNKSGKHENHWRLFKSRDQSPSAYFVLNVINASGIELELADHGLSIPNDMKILNIGSYVNKEYQ